MKIRTLVCTPADEYILNGILGDPELHERISEDDTPYLQYSTSDGTVNFLAEHDGLALGLIQTRSISRHEIDCHMNFLKNSRDLALDAALAVIKMLDDYYDWKVLTCRIPEVYPDVCGFVEKLGFKLAGNIPRCYAKNKELVGINLYYLERK